MDFIKKLTIADAITLTAVSISWLSILLLFEGHIVSAIVVSTLAFLLDVADGAIARTLKPTSHGRQLDSFADYGTYGVFSALLVYRSVAPHPTVGFIAGCLILIFGILRLIRYNQEGTLQDQHKTYYRGVTVVHLYFAVIICLLLQQSGYWSAWLSMAVIFILSPLMLSNFKSYKYSHYGIYAALAAGAVAGSILLL